MSGSATPATGEKQKNRYKSTLNLPKTSFPMKANLVQNEPASTKRWNAMGLYDRLREARTGRERFVFHDGPPYANGSIHLGHLMNKCLKDFVVRSRSLMGQDCPFVPGWDCHGLPIEHRVMTGLVESGKFEKLRELDDDTRRMAVRRECETYAHKFQKLQAEQMERLLTLGDYEHPYLTMQPAYEGAVLDVLAELLEQGLVYRALKAVHWSVENETALAEAELEYQDREDISVYVDFESADACSVYDAFGLDPEEHPPSRPSFMIWTTTPWTLPANVAMAVNPRFRYALVRMDGNLTVLAEDLVEQVAKAGKVEEVETLATVGGEALLGLRYRHPLRDDVPPFADEDADTSKVWTVVEADYVTLEDGTGIVHTATGHGAEDYQTGVREGIPVYCPVLPDGTYDETVPAWLVGKSVWEANEQVTERLRESGHLFHDHRFMHSYPHDWRSKTPVIFRATEQWFVGVDRPDKRDGKALRERALEVTASDVTFVPSWGRNRMRGMLESRPDWCVSRQRSWGLPIPAFFTPEGEAVMTAATTRAVAAVVRDKGADAWFKLSSAELLASYDPKRDPEAPRRLKVEELKKGRDILDVWFESGSSWHAAMRERSDGEDFPVELYLEGSDQHRGWFQLSLLCGLGTTGRAPMKEILTHGFMVDKDGHKLSKSKGHTIEDLLKQYGADVLRWWVCSLSYEGDVKVDEQFFANAGESYRKVRNTLRFMLSNLHDFDRDADGVDLASVPPTSPEGWVLGEYNRVAEGVVRAFERYEFKRAHELLYTFCNDTLSAVYLAGVKDRLYCDAPDGERRRRTQSALYAMSEGLCTLLAPVLCHTADEAYRALLKADPKDAERCVHLREFVRSLPAPSLDADAWSAAMKFRDGGLKALEAVKASGGVENPLDAKLVVGGDLAKTLEPFDRADLADLCGVSLVELGGDEGVSVVDLRDQPRCERSWKRDGTVEERSDGGMLSRRDAEALGLI